MNLILEFLLLSSCFLQTNSPFLYYVIKNELLGSQMHLFWGEISKILKSDLTFKTEWLAKVSSKCFNFPQEIWASFPT